MSGLSPNGVYANYDHSAAVEAIKDFYSGLDGGQDSLQEEIREFAIRLYSKRSSPNAIYFLDKTPRYHLISDQILNTFPDAKFIFLWRNPLSIISSMLKTWHRDKWYLYFFKVDLFDGLSQLVESYTHHKDRVFSINYESLLQEPEKHCAELCSYLELPFLQEMVEDFQSVELVGEMGDPTGIKTYNKISAQPIDKWKKAIKNPLRKRWCKSYLEWLGPERLATMGYDQQALLKELKDISVSLKSLHSDIYLTLYGEMYQFLELRQLQHKLKQFKTKRHRHNHPHL